ncbi:MAG: Sua5/YciO/YrdC/YwlC family protein [Mariprofundaceae bacterium]|nr:Sua5/YciO/YrdC/YwlC family protein [Mariprofundaceae bacterium]
MRAVRTLQQGGLLAHQTATVAGIAAHPRRSKSVKKLQRFKQRNGPFLLLADSISTALSQARYISPTLRKMAKNSWPGAVTLVFPAKPKHHQACYQQGMMAVRVDGDSESRRLAQLCGGLLLSSSLNRRGCPTMPLNRQLFRRFSSWLDAQLAYKNTTNSNTPSRMYHITHAGVKRLR